MEKILVTEIADPVRSSLAEAPSAVTGRVAQPRLFSGEVRMIGEARDTKKLSLARSLWERWKHIGKKVGNAQARFLLILFYFIVLGPFVLIIRRGSDPLSIQPGSPRGWRPKAEPDGTPMARAMRQF
jgi:hypothetical protein